MSIFGLPKMGTWWVSSQKDSRWNKEGRSYGYAGPREIQDWIDLCTEKYGKCPVDLEYGFMKD